MRWMQHEIIFSGVDSFGFQLHHRFFARLLCFAFPVVLLDVFLTHALWSTESAARLKIAVGAVHRSYGKAWIDANDVLLDARAVSRCIKLLLVDKTHERVDEIHALHLHRRIIKRQEKLDLVVD